MPDYERLNLIRMILVIALVIAAAALATPKNRVPLALRGILRILRKDRGITASQPPAPVSAWRRLLSFVLIILAAALALIIV
ncbi:MAG: hypothetical protein IKB76_02070 [Kiritimatiellae bacterium]|jgi:hypothetical protein|nr:hypothetical protein [Kiritimatiellia bacterium]